jgi:hypothetical protein
MLHPAGTVTTSLVAVVNQSVTWAMLSQYSRAEEGCPSRCPGPGTGVIHRLALRPSRTPQAVAQVAKSRAIDADHERVDLI